MPRSPVLAPLALSLTAAALLAACMHFGPPIKSGTPVPDANGALKIVSLDQGWDPSMQLQFWFTTQGARLLPYTWFLALEQATSREPFRSDANMNRLGYLPARPGPGSWNPDGLPVGFTQTAPAGGKTWVGFTCAACHTNQVNVNGVGLRIDGGPAMADFNGFFADMVAALQATLTPPADDPQKFDRFATRVLGGNATADQRAALLADLRRETANASSRLAMNKPTRPAGHARLDAFGNIFNQVLVTALQQPANAVAPDAPVSYPFLWDTPQHDKVQWNGSAPNGPLGVGELARNVGEVLGVFGGLSVGPCSSAECKYPNNVDIHNLGKLEGWLRGLWSPQWDTRYLPAVDSTRVQRGKTLYEQNCQSCHAPINRTDPRRTITAGMVDVGTDAQMATAAATRVARTGPLQGTLAFPTFKRFGPTDCGAALLGQAAMGVLAGDLASTLLALGDQFDAQQALLLKAGVAGEMRPSAEALKKLLPGGTPPAAALTAAANPAASCPTGVTRTYKARPLNGIWATAPYLHNGSVPSLWQLLLPPAERVSSFYVGSRSFDPVDVGFDTRSGPYLFDTRLQGNRNDGHDYGSTLPEGSRRDLLEYLKTL